MCIRLVFLPDLNGYHPLRTYSAPGTVLSTLQTPPSPATSLTPIKAGELALCLMKTRRIREEGARGSQCLETEGPCTRNTLVITLRACVS